MFIIDFVIVILKINSSKFYGFNYFELNVYLGYCKI